MLYSAPAPYVRARVRRAQLMPHVHVTILKLIAIFWAEQSSGLNVILQACKKEQRQVNKKFCELKGGNIGIVEKAQETRFGMS